MKLAGLQKPVP